MRSHATSVSIALLLLACGTRTDLSRGERLHSALGPYALVLQVDELSEARGSGAAAGLTFRGVVSTGVGPPTGGDGGLFFPVEDVVPLGADVVSRSGTVLGHFEVNDFRLSYDSPWVRVTNVVGSFSGPSTLCESGHHEAMVILRFSSPLGPMPIPSRFTRVDCGP